MQTLETPVKIDASIAPKLREWFANGRGVRVWRNADLSSGNVGKLVFTPGDVETAPHWQYANAGTIDPAQVTVETFTPRMAFNGAAKRRYWGMDVSDASRAKATRLTQPGESWAYSIEYDYGRTFAKIEIGVMVETAFTL